MTSAAVEPQPEPSAERLERALASQGVHCTVEVRGRLAILRDPAADDTLDRPGLRARIVAVAREHGFTHAALEL